MNWLENLGPFFKDIIKEVVAHGVFELLAAILAVIALMIKRRIGNENRRALIISNCVILLSFLAITLPPWPGFKNNIYDRSFALGSLAVLAALTVLVLICVDISKRFYRWRKSPKYEVKKRKRDTGDEKARLEPLKRAVAYTYDTKQYENLGLFQAALRAMLVILVLISALPKVLVAPDAGKSGLTTLLAAKIANLSWWVKGANAPVEPLVLSLSVFHIVVASVYLVFMAVYFARQRQRLKQLRKDNVDYIDAKVGEVFQRTTQIDLIFVTLI